MNFKYREAEVHESFQFRREARPTSPNCLTYGLIGAGRTNCLPATFELATCY